MFPLCGSCLCYMWMAGLKQIISHFYTKSRAGVLNFIARHIIILVALKGPVVSIRLDVQSTPSPSEVKNPPSSLTSKCTPIPCPAARKKLGAGSGKQKFQGLEEDQNRSEVHCWSMLNAEAREGVLWLHKEVHDL